MKPYANQQCSGESGGVGYLFNVVSGECISLVSINQFNQSNTINTSSSLKVNVFGLIGLFEFYDNSDCTSDPNQFSDAFKHNQCYQLPPLLSVDFGQQPNQDDVYFMISFLDNPNLITPILNQEYGLKKIQYDSTTSDNCQGSDFQFAQLISNNFTITNSNNNQIDTFYCNNMQPTLKNCINNTPCSFTPLSINCNNGIIQTC
ncbi:hypothetical protein DICPUDRAFT_77246 [Dictyostelium purpureum]|uniref:Uncharacterized protein n=1 Tax=Dictyostelium purpureum TaxID=5786 RepID=F0ZG19_DICPU|nr:uncharacterized protein DICPUDRAFT_77246 [Dictyostelium purpureum]EGC37105.1 hypothetical protein DICPUDRAFT_77246 [Dictyostelium purpureum]|eukprot:XP_003286386.1 hypothetical protein DICPUDRAFT_77246 [Dictyostelium purpureum]